MAEGDESKKPGDGDQGGAEGQGQGKQSEAEAKSGGRPARKKPTAAELKEQEEALLKRKPWLKPDYNGPLTANQATERGRVLRMKGYHPDGTKINQK
jgi:hypothetical protein